MMETAVFVSLSNGGLHIIVIWRRFLCFAGELQSHRLLPFVG